MPTTFNDVFIDGNQDVKQLRIQANPTGQTQPLQTWENSDGTVVLGQISKDGNVQLGDDLLGWSTPDALIEAHRADTSTTRPKRGFHSLGRIANLLSDVITWAVTELELLGTAGVSGLQTAFRARLTHNNSGDSTSAELRAGDFQATNQTGSSGARVGQATGVRGTANNTPGGANAYLSKAVGVEGAIANAAGGDITDAAAFEVAAPSNNGTIATLYGLRIPDLTQGSMNYAILTGLGPVRLGDFVELKRPTAVPGQPSTDLIRLYPKADGKLYARNWSNQEFDLTGGGGGSAPIAGLCHGRLTLSSGTPIPIVDVMAAATLYFTPFRGNQVALFDGAQWTLFLFTESSLSLSGLVANTLYDIFLYDNAGVLTLEAVAWNAPDNGVVTSISNASPRVVTVPSHTLSAGQLVTIASNSVASNNATWRVGGTITSTQFRLLNLNGTNSSAPGSVGSGGTWQRADQNTTRATPLAVQDGVFVQSGAPAHRYLGTIRMGNLAGQSEDSATKRYLYNEYNQVARKLKVVEPEGQWSYSTSAWRAANNNLANRVGIVIGNVGPLVGLDLVVRMQGSGAGGAQGMAYDAVNTNHADVFPNVSTNTLAAGHLRHYPAEGYHYYHWVENGRGQACTMYGYSANGFQSGMVGEVML